MRIQGWRMWKWLGVLVLVPLYFFVMTAVHETGHALVARSATTAEIRIYLWPGFELYPSPGKRHEGEWPAGAGGYTFVDLRMPIPAPTSAPLMTLPVPSDSEAAVFARRSPLILLMGSGTTSLLSLLCLSLIWLCKPRGMMLALLVAGGLLHLDMLTYTVLPVFFGVPHLYFIGGTNPEPMVGLIRMGLAREPAIALILLNSALQFASLYVLLKRQRRANLSTRAPLSEVAS